MTKVPEINGSVAAELRAGLWTRFKVWLWNILIGLDQLLNCILAGHPDETFSARAWRKALAGQWFWRLLRWGIDRVFFWEKDHCRQSFESEAARKHSPREFADG